MAGIQIVQGISIGFVESGKLSLTVWPGLNEKYLFITQSRVEWSPLKVARGPGPINCSLSSSEARKAGLRMRIICLSSFVSYNTTNLALQSQSVFQSFPPLLNSHCTYQVYQYIYLYVIKIDMDS